MGSYIEINDTLQLTTEQGFPASVFNLAKHQKKPITLADVQGRLFKFKDKPNARIYQLDPVRVFFAHNIGGRWLPWGHVYLQSQTIYKKLEADGTWKEGNWLTAGTYTISAVYDPEFQRQFAMHELPQAWNYFLGPGQK